MYRMLQVAGAIYGRVLAACKVRELIGA
jgi:hypothetical protein